MKEKFDLGEIEYRYPGAIEAMDLSVALSSMGEEATRMAYMKEIVSNMEPFITKVKVSYNGKKLKSFSELMSCPNVRVASALVRIAGDLYNAMFTSEAEKKQ